MINLLKPVFHVKHRGFLKQHRVNAPICFCRGGAALDHGLCGQAALQSRFLKFLHQRSGFGVRRADRRLDPAEPFQSLGLLLGLLQLGLQVLRLVLFSFSSYWSFWFSICKSATSWLTEMDWFRSCSAKWFLCCITKEISSRSSATQNITVR